MNAVDVTDDAATESIEVSTADALMERLNVDKATALRFARARKGDLVKAEAFLAADIKWRTETKPEAVTQADVSIALPSGCWRLLGATEGGFQVLFIQLGLWNPDKYDTEEYGRYANYFLEAMCKLGERFIVIFDMKGWKLSHAWHMKKIARLVSTLQDHYPERLEKALLMRAPGIFAGAWTVIKGFIDPVTVKKVAFVSSSAEAETMALKACGAWSVVPKCYNGDSDAAPPVPNIPGEKNIEGAPPLVPASTPAPTPR